jgi:hypothetical protein
VIAFASCIGSMERFTRHAAPALQRALEPDSQFAELTTDTSILEVYNEALEHFAGVEELEALVLLHDDVEILDPEHFCERVRTVLSDPEIAIAGAVGARGVTGLNWWDGEVAGAVIEPRGFLEGDLEDREVDAVDGLLMVLSPWAVQHLRCDTATFHGSHASDVDLCFPARAAGRRVIAADFPVCHHTKGGYGDPLIWKVADDAFRAKWSAAR